MVTTTITPNFEDAMYRLRHDRRTNQFLYYYTTAETLNRILDNRCIRTSKYDSVNDLDEANLDYLNGNLKTIEVDRYIKENCHFISFVYDYKKYKETIEGVQHPRMWAQYAHNSEGACLILNKSLFINKCLISKRNSTIFLGKVKYSWSKFPQKNNDVINNFCVNSTPKEIVKRYKAHIFLTKHIDWEQEHEMRLCIIGNREHNMISIDGCIEGICLGKKFVDDSSRIIKLAEKLYDTNRKFNIKITDEAFGIIASTEGGYDSWSVHPNLDIKIGRIIESLHTLQYKSE